MTAHTIHLLDVISSDEELQFKNDIAKALLYVNPSAIAEFIISSTSEDSELINSSKQYTGTASNSVFANLFKTHDEFTESDTIELSDGVEITLRLSNSPELALEISDVKLNFEDNSYVIDLNNFNIKPLITHDGFSVNNLIENLSKMDINKFNIHFMNHESPISFIIDQFFEFTDIENVW